MCVFCLSAWAFPGKELPGPARFVCAALSLTPDSWEQGLGRGQARLWLGWE